MKRVEYKLAEHIAHSTVERADYDLECRELGIDPLNYEANSKGPDAHIFAIAKVFLDHPEAKYYLDNADLIKAAADLLHAAEIMHEAVETHGKEISDGLTKATTLLMSAIKKAKGVQ